MRLAPSEHETQTAIGELLTAEGVFWFRLNSVSFAAEHKGKKRFFSAHSLGRGAADIYCTPPCWVVKDLFAVPVLGHLWIECKAPGGTQSEDQKRFQEWVVRKGHSYLVAFSSDNVLGWLRENGRYSQ